MKGVVLFADDEIHDTDGPEHRLYQLFREEYVVLTVDNLEHLDRALKSISNFDVIILDWEFIEKRSEFADEDFGGLKLKKNPLPILEPLKLFSKIYVYSNADIPQQARETFLRLFPGRVEFKQKNIRTDEPKGIAAEYELIKSELHAFSAKNQNLDFSLIWSRAINQSLQGIFSELSAAHSSWLKFLYETSLEDNLDAILEVVQLMNNLLAEELIQNLALRDTIAEQAKAAITPPNPDQKAAKLFQRIYYTAVNGPDIPIMTGDIFDISEEEYAILVTPECDVYFRYEEKKYLKEFLEVLIFHKNDIIGEFKKPNPDSEDQKKKFNQSAQAKHILPSFPYDNETRLLPGVINFSSALRSIPSTELKEIKRRYKVNAPYIQQLRQRFSAAHSRVGVPAINDLVKRFNLIEVKNLLVPPTPQE